MIFVKGDTQFAAWARQLQNDCREKPENDFPIRTYKNPKGEFLGLGNYIDRDFAFEKKRNLLTKNIRDVVEKTL